MEYLIFCILWDLFYNLFKMVVKVLELLTFLGLVTYFFVVREEGMYYEFVTYFFVFVRKECVMIFIVFVGEVNCEKVFKNRKVIYDYVIIFK